MLRVLPKTIYPGFNFREIKLSDKAVPLMWHGGNLKVGTGQLNKVLKM